MLRVARAVARATAIAASPSRELPRVVEHVVALVAPGVGEREQEPLERGPPVAVARREVGAAEERHARRA